MEKKRKEKKYDYNKDIGLHADFDFTKGFYVKAGCTSETTLSKGWDYLDGEKGEYERRFVIRVGIFEDGEGEINQGKNLPIVIKALENKMREKVRVEGEMFIIEMKEKLFPSKEKLESEYIEKSISNQDGILWNGLKLLEDVLKEGTEVIGTNGLRFNGTSEEKIKQVFEKHGIEYKNPF